MDCSVTYESVKKATTKSTSNYTRDGYSSWIASRCHQTSTKSTSVKNKYSSSGSNDSYSRWIDERLERLKRADATNKSLISSLFSGMFNLNISINTPKINTTEQNEVLSVEFTKSGVYTQTPEGKEAVIKPIGEDYEVITTSDGEIVVKLPSGGNAVVYNENKNAIGSANNIYGSNGIDVNGKMVIDGKEVDVRVVAGDTDWGEVLGNIGKDVASGVATVTSSATNAGIGFIKGIGNAIESLADAYVTTKSNIETSFASVIGNVARFTWI